MEQEEVLLCSIGRLMAWQVGRWTGRQIGRWNERHTMEKMGIGK